ncbi:phosphoglycolate phosphatase [Pararhodobacter sp.]|uniref:phosphoglycolate phosphatase n=1 Tax=Pararhodobacter sp. TaxID=2127056 RepID=UPI002FDCA2B1
MPPNNSPRPQATPHPAGGPQGAIVFDLDGTLIDSAPDLHAALNKVLTEEGATPVSLQQTRGFIGHGIPHLVRAARLECGIDPAREAAMTASMFRHYMAAPARLSRPYPGAVACLEALQARGHPLGLCTNKAIAPTRMILKALDLERFFSVVIGGDSVAQKKPDPAPLLAAFAPLGPPLLYVGDSEVDGETALAAGIPFALHTEGYRKAPLHDLPHRFAFSDFAQLAPWVASGSDAPA